MQTSTLELVLVTKVHGEAVAVAGIDQRIAGGTYCCLLAKLGIMIGSIFVVTLVMGDFITVRFMSGSQSASVGRLIQNEIALLQYPAAAASAVVPLLTVLIMIAVVMRLVDIRKEL